ncbi:MAG: VPLPA-CTERM sorting domain-containing protein [Proteobacteria bacterium]|nr:VPLPA-CTERM sorting domain-containing protein [Pseudomonadota bacterium]
MIRKITLLVAMMALIATPALATPWEHPLEPSVAWVYNQHYGTNYSIDTKEGLADLLADHGATALSTWNTVDFGFLRMEVFDTSSTTPLTLRYGDDFSQSMLISDPGPWTSPTRGYLPDGQAYINLRSILGQNEDFQLFVGDTNLDAGNSILAMGLNNKSFLLGYNGGGWSGDSDFNEPLVHMAETPIPAAAWLLGSGLMGLIGLRRKTV